MKAHTKIIIALFVVGLVVMFGYRVAAPYLEASSQKKTSDARATKGKLIVGVDNWIGYFHLCSDDMRKRMRHSGYVIKCVDDNADYADRMKRLDKGEYQFAVATVDSYLLNGKKQNYPGTIVSVIDESKGGDAVVANAEMFNSIDDLKMATDTKIAFTPNSPSEHLLKSIAVHFDLPHIISSEDEWALHSDGSADALKRLQNGNANVAVLWEPDVSRATSTGKFVKLLGTEDTNKLIVDVLIVNREFSASNPEAVKTLMRNYYLSLKHYRDNHAEMVTEVVKNTALSKDTVETLFKGVVWQNLSDNAENWFGVASSNSIAAEGLIDAIDGAVQILVDSGDFDANPIPNEDPYRLTNSQFVTDLYNRGGTQTQFGMVNKNSNTGTSGNGTERKFHPITDQEWEALREVGTMKVRPIVFQSGSPSLTYEGKLELDKAAENLKHYPNFRVLVKGHTGLRGDANANRELSQLRAESVVTYLSVTHGIDFNRVRPVGYGSSSPLPKKPGESSRAYNYRLPRVELALVTEDI